MVMIMLIITSVSQSSVSLNVIKIILTLYMQNILISCDAICREIMIRIWLTDRINLRYIPLRNKSKKD
jgi:hypothetical protein